MFVRKIAVADKQCHRSWPSIKPPIQPRFKQRDSENEEKVNEVFQLRSRWKWISDCGKSSSKIFEWYGGKKLNNVRIDHCELIPAGLTLVLMFLKKKKKMKETSQISKLATMVTTTWVLIWREDKLVTWRHDTNHATICTSRDNSK